MAVLEGVTVRVPEHPLYEAPSAKVAEVKPQYAEDGDQESVVDWPCSTVEGEEFREAVQGTAMKVASGLQLFPSFDSVVIAPTQLVLLSAQAETV